DATRTSRSIAAPVKNLTGVATAIVAGDLHTCVLIGTAVWCWGHNNQGQLGDGTMSDNDHPVQVTGLAMPVVSLTGGGSHTCALLADFTLVCWGYTGDGELGTGACCTASATPVVVTTMTNVMEVASSASFSCARKSDGTVWCWGYGEGDQCGNQSNNCGATPVQVANVATATALTVGYSHACAQQSDRSVTCWGHGYSGQIGDGNYNYSSDPIKITSVAGVNAVSAGGSFTCVTKDDGIPACWGNDRSGQLGDGVLNLPTLQHVHLTCP